MRGDRNLTRYFLLISIFIILIIFALFGTITLDSREEVIADQYKQTYTFNYTFKIETYLPSSYTIKVEDNASYVLSGTSFSGKSLKKENTLKPNSSTQIECAPGIYKLSITSTSTQRKEPLIEKKVIGRSFYQISPLLLYFLTIFLAVLFSLSDRSNYLEGKNSRYSTANISFTFFWILQFLFKLDKSDIDKNELNSEIEIATKNPSGDLKDKIKEIVEKKNGLKALEYTKLAAGVILTKNFSRECYSKALAFRPSYLYYPTEFLCNIVIKKIYVPRSIQILKHFTSLEDKDKNETKKAMYEIEKNIKSACGIIAFDSTYPSILLAIVVSILSFLGISLIEVPLSFLLVKLSIIFYLVLNIIIVIFTPLKYKRGWL
jgi:hypothetical protein